MKDEAKRVEEAIRISEIYEKCKKGFYQILKDSGQDFSEGRKKFEKDWDESLTLLKDLARSYLSVLKDPKVPEVMIKDGGGGICGECDVESYNSCRSQFIPLLIVKDREIAELKERATEAETRAKWYDTLVKTKLMGSKFSNLRQYVESLEAENAELRKGAGK